MRAGPRKQVPVACLLFACVATLDQCTPASWLVDIARPTRVIPQTRWSKHSAGTGFDLLPLIVADLPISAPLLRPAARVKTRCCIEINHEASC